MTTWTGAGGRLIIVSNRLPFVAGRDQAGQWSLTPGAGGLVTALAPVLRNRGGLWIGWPGAVAEDEPDLEPLLAQAVKGSGYQLRPILLSREERAKFYHGFANEIIWPLFHDLFLRCNFDPAYFIAHLEVNRRFARAVRESHRPGDFVWVHDYHLVSVAEELRRMGLDSRLGFFLHIPFPAIDIFLKLPWRFRILQALLEYDLIGFQTVRDRRNFLDCARRLLKGVVVQGKGQVLTVAYQGREVRVGAFPISIDFGEFSRQAASPAVSERVERIRKEFAGRRIILGVDRLDYTKGLPERLAGFREALLRHPELQEKINFVEVVVPSRVQLPRYHELKIEVERLVGEINGQFTRHGWVPIHYLFRPLDREELVAFYRAAETALVTPLKDGMNLVAKEFCACSPDEDSVLILSEFAGAAAQLHENALLVNPHDVEGLAEAIHQAWLMPLEERRRRMKKLRQAVRRQDIYWWVNSFLQAAIAKRLDNFPVVADYLPRLESQTSSGLMENN